MTSEQWRRVLSVNLDGAFFCAPAAGATMVKQGSGVMLNIPVDGGYLAV